ncbi:hypothetical protein FACS189419_09240 [Planctomycetales bacterium]|nr:hypothetical protein FACS189419_09240 [Planctomycetales bacterium]
MAKKSSKPVTFVKCPCAGTTLDKLIQPALLAVLSESSLHGYELARRIGNIPGFLEQAPDVSGIYKILKSLEERGMVVSDWAPPKNDRAKRIFTITKDGITCLEHWQKTLQEHRKAVNALIRTTQKALNR